MLHIQQGLDHGYTTSRPVIVLTHGFSRDELRELIKLAKEQLNESEILSVLGLTAPARSEGSFMCIVEGALPPSVTHPSKEVAIKEAERLAMKTGSDTAVVQIVAKARRKKIVANPEYETTTTHF